jgi:2'-5' RNA ligase
LTLVFIGDSDGAQTSLVKAVMDKIDLRPFTITMDSIGYFKRGSGSLWWAGVKENKELTDLHHDLTERLTSIGFTTDERKYTPHITLGRDIVCNYSSRQIEPFSEAVSSIELMRSERIDGKLTYTPIFSRRASE